MRSDTDIVTDIGDPRTAFIEAATWHGDLDRAKAILAAHPEVASCDIHTAAILGDDAAVRRFIAEDPGNATATSEPYGGNALVYLGLSKYLRFDKSLSDAFLRAATALLDAGADPNSGFWTTGQHPEFETALYGAAGVAHHAPLTRLLLERGADPNDIEVVYHSPETWDNEAMKALVDTGKITAENLALMLIRKHDWHDVEGAKFLLERGADPNWARKRGWYAIHHALARDNALEMIELLLDHGADPLLVNDGLSAAARAARAGRSDVLELFKRRGISVALNGVDNLIAACACDDSAAVRRIVEREPHLVAEIRSMGGDLLAKFAGTNNPAGVRQLLDLGVDIAAPFTEGDGYFGEPKGSLAIHVAAWRGNPAVVKLLIERGSPVDVPDANGRTPLALAVRACVDSYWTDRRTPESVAALLAAGASVSGVAYPCGYAEVDELLRGAMPKNTFGGVSPIFRVGNLAASLAYYVDALGFKVDWEYKGAIAAVSRDRCCIFLCQGDQGNPGSWAWVGVNDVERLCDEFRAKGAKIRQPPTNFPWALEIQVEDPDGNVLRFGSEPKPDQPFGPWMDMHGKLWESLPEGGWKRVE